MLSNHKNKMIIVLLIIIVILLMKVILLNTEEAKWWKSKFWDYKCREIVKKKKLFSWKFKIIEKIELFGL